jgi:protein-tyrosine phosphatase
MILHALDCGVPELTVSVTMTRQSILFVCLGNICRSPLAEGVFRAVLAERGLADSFLLDSAGTGAWHVNSAPDPRSIAIASAHGIDISGLKARKVQASDFTRFDLVLGMDKSNVDDLRAMAPSDAAKKIHRFLDFAGGSPDDVPDPYYGGSQGFGDVYRMIRVASETLLLKFEARASATPSGQASSIT